MQEFDIVTVGNALLDLSMKVSEDNSFASLDASAQELRFKFGQKIHVTNCSFFSGGNACNVGVGLSRLGLKTALIAEIGDDEFAERIMRRLKKEPIDTSLMIKTQNASSSFSVGINYKSERTLFVQHVKREHNFVFDNIQTKWIYLTSLGVEWRQVYKRVVDFVQNKSVKLAFSPGTHQYESFGSAQDKEEGKKLIFDILRSVDILFVNKEEGERISNFSPRFGEAGKFQISNEYENSQNIKQLLDKLKNLGPKVVVATDGPNGSYSISEDGKMYKFGIFPCEVVGKTGAGDAYASGFLSAIMLGKKVDEAMAWGTMNATAAIEQLGAQTGLLTKEEMQKRLAEHREAQAKEL